MANKANIISFKSTPSLVKLLRDLRIFYGQATRSKLLIENIVPEALFAVYKNPMPKDLSPEQKRAYKRIMVNMTMVNEVAKECIRLQNEREKEAKDNKVQPKKKSKLKKRKK